MRTPLYICVILLGWAWDTVYPFSIAPNVHQSAPTRPHSSLYAKKKRRRVRKKSPSDPSQPENKVKEVATAAASTIESSAPAQVEAPPPPPPPVEVMASAESSSSSAAAVDVPITLEFKADGIVTGKQHSSLQNQRISLTPYDQTDPSKPEMDLPAAGPEKTSAIPLPDIKEALKQKEIEKEKAKEEAEKEMQRPKIRRSDKEAYTRLLESQPFADADESFFEEEEYGTISALLGERAKPFLSIPTGPLQVGHFIGALGIVLMAFVEYPGFPLTNLPTAIRGALQGGLAAVFVINAILAGFSVFKASERDQPVPLWAAKTFSVGGLAFDQLTQLPTKEEIEKAKSMKGARAVGNRKR